MRIGAVVATHMTRETTSIPSPPASRRTGRSLTVVLAHDPRSRACDMLASHVLAVAARLRGVAQLEEVGSLEAAWVTLDRARWARDDTLVLSCLDLPPVPRGAVTVMGWARSLRMPFLAVTHGRRWLPPGVDDVTVLSPLAAPDDVERTVRALVPDPGAGRPERGIDVIEAPPESFPGRPSWLG